jgi:SAM-dependent methyltransferase
VIEPQFLAEFELFLASDFAKQAFQQQTLVGTWPTREDPFTFQHERIAFPSYPYEWPAEMLYAAAKLTLELALGALPEGFRLKDATPYNVLYSGFRPVFVDLLSFETRDPLDPAWMAYGQFVRTFVLPLLAHKHFGLTLQQAFAGTRDGLDPETVYQWSGPLQLLRPPFLGLVSLPRWLSGRAQSNDIYQVKPAASAEQATYILRGLLNRAHKQLDSVAPGNTASTWTGYLDHKSLYSPSQLAQKERFVQEALDFAKPRRMLDVGANEGHFSLMAAHAGASVVAIDTDPAVVGSIWKKAKQEGADVLPLVVDLTRPSPATGWMNQENLSFLERAQGHFDMVSMLAVVHHILVTERIPLENLLELADQLLGSPQTAETDASNRGSRSKGYLLVEFVGPEDPMFRKILRGREKLYTHVSREWFETKAQERFELIRSEKLDGLDRWLYLLQRRSAKS